MHALTIDKGDHVCVSEGAEDGELVEGEGAVARRVDCRAAKEARAQTQEREGTRAFGEKASAGDNSLATVFMASCRPSAWRRTR